MPASVKPKKPHVTKDLLAWLQHCFPDKAPSPTATDREVWLGVGAVQVVRHLQKIYEEQEGA